MGDLAGGRLGAGRRRADLRHQGRQHRRGGQPEGRLHLAHPGHRPRRHPAQAAQLGPTLNVQISPTIDGVHPDVTFTGANSTVPWAVWYEEPNNLAPGAVAAAPNNLRVFAAKFVPDPAQGDRGGQWIPVGNGAGCAFQTGSEDPNACSLNKDPNANAENPNVAAGSLNPAAPDRALGGLARVDRDRPGQDLHQPARPGRERLPDLPRPQRGRQPERRPHQDGRRARPLLRRQRAARHLEGAGRERQAQHLRAHASPPAPAGSAGSGRRRRTCRSTRTRTPATPASAPSAARRS